MYNRYNLFFGMLLLFSCEDQLIESDGDFGYDYFPLNVGAFWIYDVQEINFDASGPDTIHYELRNSLSEKVEQDENSYYILNREKRIEGAVDWQISDVWMIRQNQFTGIVSEENIPYAKLTFPVVINKTWDGNAFNTLAYTEYRYKEADPASYDELIADQAKVKVQISDIPKNIVNRDERFEVYARGVGLVEKNYIILNYCTANCGTAEIDSGIIIEQVLKAYGQD